MKRHAPYRHTLCCVLLLTLLLSSCAPFAAPQSAAEPAAEPAAEEQRVYATIAVESESALSSLSAAPLEPISGLSGDVFSTGGSSTVNDAAYDATFFKNYGVNPFVDTEDDHLSTFAMDVDTASYTVARRYLNDGNLPEPDSVRVEEFINYFDQAYESPGDQVFAIHLEGAPSPFGNDKHWLMRVGLQGKHINDENRKDATLIFVIDVSGSMDQENRLGLVKKSLRLLVDELRPSDEVGIVIYGSQGRVVMEPTSAANQDRILSAIDSLRSEGATNAEEGLLLAYQMAAPHLQPDRITRLILLSDGVANVGNTGPDSILAKVRGFVADGITLSSVGFGMGNYNDVLMEQLANDGDGNYYYVDTLDQAHRVFVENLTGLLQVIAKDAKIQVDFNPDVVRSYRLLGYENRRVDDDDFRNDDVDAGEVGAGHSVTALYELKFQDDVVNEEDAAATLYIRFLDPDTGEVVENSQSISRAGFSPDLEMTTPHFQLDAAVAEFAEILRESYWAQEGNLADVLALAEQVQEQLAGDADVAEFVTVVERANGLSR